MCARWLHHNKPVEHLLGVLQGKETNAEAIAGNISDFLQSRSITFEKMRGLGFDGASTMSGNRTGVQTRLRLHAPSAIYVHCCCHLLQLAGANAASEHAEVKRVLGILLTNWKAFYYSPKKAEKLKEIQAEFQCPQVKMQKPSDTRWLARERAVRAVRLILPALVSTFKEIYDETGDTEAHGIAILSTKYKTLACIYMLCDVLHTVAALQASVPAMVKNTTRRLMGLKEKVKIPARGSRIILQCSLMMRNLEQRTLWSQRKKRTCFFTRSIVGKCKVLLTTLIEGWSLPILSLLSLFLIHDISQLTINWQTMT